MKQIRFSILLSYTLLTLSSCGTLHVSEVSTRQYVMNDSLQPSIDSSIYKLADPYRQQLVAQMSEVLCTTSTVLEKGTPEGLLGNFVTDVCLEMGNRRIRAAGSGSMEFADFIILNNGGLRKPLPKGAITLGDLYEVMPFENQLVVLTCRGALVQQIINFVASKGGAPVSGIRFRINKRSENPEDILIQNQPLDTAKDYRIMTADYLANGGDQFELFKNAAKRQDVGLKIRDALIEYTTEKGKKGEPISANIEGRITTRNE